ncbi:MAG: FtsX-like permease family protein, partial [Oscillospiraceae bacterium]|nr:FtsX-like permease family protein [Oscillospiraceae bacterium]
EEQRTQIGSLKARGFSRLAIAKKYIGYAFSASLVGGILGLGLGCTLIPLVIANAFNIMYAIPALEFKPQVGLYVWAVLAAVACTTGAALWAWLSTLIATPANLMRPRAPKAGRRVFLERIRPIWKRLTFTWKVTMRNLFRYQRRFWMTVIGIGGCTALIVTGFGLHESIFSILNEQFDHVFLYDATVGLDKDAGAQKLGSVERYLTDSPWVEDYLITSETMLEASSSGPAQNVYLFAVDDLERFNEFIQLGHRLDDGSVTLPDGGVVITEKLSELLGVSVGDTITLDGDKRVDAVVADIAENYVSHYVYLSNTCYQELFGEEPEQNVMLLRYADGAGEEESDTVSSQLMAMDGVDSYSYIATLRDNFTDSMEAIDYAVVIIIVAAAALAFVVLYNLTNINITERVRELATLKRNLFRYQRRFWMTVIGIGGCTALIVTGFGLHESIFSILNEQFDHVFLYDATVGLDKDAGAQKLGSVERYLTDSPWVEDYLITSETMLEASSSGPAQNVYLFAVDDLERFNEFIQLGHRLDDGSVTLPDGGVVITEKLSELLGVSVGDTITLDGDKRVDAVVADIAENYVSHYVYLSNTCYQELFGEEPEQNVMLLRYADGAGEEESDTVSSQLMAMDGVDSYSYIATLRDNFTDSMEAIDYAVVIIIVAAAALAFVVLYNLTNINITERVRELATLKVLGFYDREVTAYVYRENLFLTLFGIVLGLVMGRFLHAWMVLTVEVDIVMFGRAAPPYAYVLAAVLTVVFSVAVNIAAHFKLKKVDMVESLKTVE